MGFRWTSLKLRALRCRVRHPNLWRNPAAGDHSLDLPRPTLTGYFDLVLVDKPTIPAPHNRGCSNSVKAAWSESTRNRATDFAHRPSTLAHSFRRGNHMSGCGNERGLSYLTRNAPTIGSGANCNPSYSYSSSAKYRFRVKLL